jgi:hypothetical protein
VGADPMRRVIVGGVASISRHWNKRSSADASSNMLPPTQRAALERLFVQRLISATAITTIAVTNLKTLQALAKKGLVVFTEEPLFGTALGKPAWLVVLTDAGRKELR